MLGITHPPASHIPCWEKENHRLKSADWEILGGDILYTYPEAMFRFTEIHENPSKGMMEDEIAGVDGSVILR